MEKEILLMIISKASNANKYVRLAFVFLLMSILISSIGCWNSLQTSWLDSKIGVHKTLLSNYDTISNIHVKLHLLNLGEIDLNKRLLEEVNLIPGVFNENERIKLMQAYNYFDLNIYTEPEVKEVLKGLRDSRLNRMSLIEIPALGIVIHVNDISLFTGIAFMMALFMLVLSYGRKKDQIEDAIEALERMRQKDELNEAPLYYFTSKLIVGTRLVEIASKRNLSRLQLFSRGILILPVIIQAIIILNDFRTLDLGMMQSRFMSITLILFSGVLLVLNVFLTRMVFGFRNDLNTIFVKLNS